MNLGRTVFAQLMDELPSYEFRKCVARYGGDHKLRGFSCWDQFLCLSFAQLTYRESLRDIQACLRSVQPKLYHMGFRGKVSRSTLADANESHDWRIYADFAQILIRIARPLYARDPIGVDLDQSLYALDSTTIDLCLSLFPWAKFRRHKAAVKMHTLLDLHGNIPTFIRITDGKTHDVNILDEIAPEPGAFYVMDRAYVDFERLFAFTLCSSFFVVRTKKNILLQRRYSHRVDKSTGRALGSDRHPDSQRLGESLSGRVAASQLRRRRDQQASEVFDQQLCAPGSDHRPDLQVALAGRIVLQVDQAAPEDQEVLRHFRERREDADLDRRLGLRTGGDRAQEVGLEASLYQILQILSVTLFEKTPILQAFGDPESQKKSDPIYNQLNLWDL